MLRTLLGLVLAPLLTMPFCADGACPPEVGADKGTITGKISNDGTSSDHRDRHPSRPKKHLDWWELDPGKGCIRTVTGYRCPQPTTKPKGPDPSAHVREVVAKLKLPDPTPRFGPDPSVNEWNMLAVGFPIWLWTDQPTQLTTTAHHDGLTFQLTATWQSTTFNMGDGHTKTCTTTTPYPPHLDKPGRPSPTCGYIYDTRSPKGHPYTVTADTHWQIDWAAAGQTGTLNTTYTGNRTLDVGELQSLVTG